MADSNDKTTPDVLTKADLEALVASFEQKLEVAKASFKTELDIQANKIHSSYAKKTKKSADEPEDEDVSNRKPTKNELKMQADIEALVKRAEEGELKAKKASQRNAVSDILLKTGVAPEALDTLLTVFEAKGMIVEDDVGLKMKVDAEGVNVALPLDSAVKHWAKSAEAKFFLAPKGAAGSGANPVSKTSSTPTNGKPKPMVEVDWEQVGKDLVHTS